MSSADLVTQLRAAGDLLHILAADALESSRPGGTSALSIIVLRFDIDVQLDQFEARRIGLVLDLTPSELRE